MLIIVKSALSWVRHVRLNKMGTPHKHAELIKAWADGAEIEYKDEPFRKWTLLPYPHFNSDGEYRIKPEPKPDKILYAVFGFDGKNYHDIAGLWNNTDALPGRFNKDQFKTVSKIKFIIDGEDFTKLKSVEIIK